MFAKTRLLTTICLSLLTISSTIFADEYKIKLSPPQKVGQSTYFITHLDEKLSNKVSQGTTVLQDKQIHTIIDFEGTAIIKKVNSKGLVIAETLIVKKCTLTIGGTTNELLKDGTAVEAFLKDGIKSFTIDGNPTPPEVTQVLNKVVQYSDTETTDDAIYGTTELKKISDSWPVKAELACEEYNKKGMLNLKADNISGTTTLLDVVEKDGEKCLKVEAKLDIKGVPMPLPAGLTTEKSTVATSMVAYFPIDENSRGAIEDYSTMKMELVAKGKQNPMGPELSINTSLETEITRTAKYLD
jgi:hypothetical protein